MRRILALLTLSFMLAAVGCAEVSDPDTKLSQQKIVNVGGTDVVVEIVYEPEVSDEDAAALLDSVVVADGAFTATARTSGEELTIDAADPGWATIPVPFDIVVKVNADTGRVMELEDMRWYWTERELLANWCPPGH